MFESIARNVSNVCTCAIIVYMNSQCFMAKEKNILRVKELNSQDLINFPVKAVNLIEKIINSLFSSLIYEYSLVREYNKSDGEENSKSDSIYLSRQKLIEIREMKKAVKRAAFAENYDCFRRWESLYAIIKNNQWTFNALEYIEIYLASQKDCLLMYIEEKVVLNVFDYIVSTLAKLSNGDREVFLKLIKEYNNLPVFKIDFTKEDLHIKTVDKKRDFVQQIFLENFDLEIPLEIWINIYFEASEDEENVFAQKFRSKPYIAFLKKLNKMQTAL